MTLGNSREGGRKGENEIERRKERNYDAGNS
jgi:hypothetical protein